MTVISPPPVYDPLIEDPTNPVVGLRWLLFFTQIFNGDTGTSWTPTFTNLTVVGAAPTITGTVYKLSQGIAYFSVKIVPGTNTSSTAGTTYIDNFPFSVKTPGACFALSGNLGTNAGMVESSSSRIYTPGWAAVTIPLWIVGMCEIQ